MKTKIFDTGAFQSNVPRCVIIDPHFPDWLGHGSVWASLCLGVNKHPSRAFPHLFPQHLACSVIQSHANSLDRFGVLWIYPWWESGEENLYLDNWYEFGFREFDGLPQLGDMVIMQVSAPVANHAGILLEGNMLLHHMYGKLSQREPYCGYLRERTVKVVRYKAA